MSKLKIRIICFFYFIISLAAVTTEALANENDSKDGLFIGIGGHTLDVLPTPTFDIGFDTSVANARIRYPFLGVGRLNLEVAARYDSAVKIYPYMTYGRDYYVVGFDSFIGIGIEYVFENERKYLLVEWTRRGLKPGETDSDFNPKNTISIGFGLRNRL